MAPTPLEQDHPEPAPSQAAMLASSGKQRIGFGMSSRDAGGQSSTSAAPALALTEVSLEIADGLLMAFGPVGDPIPPGTFVDLAAEQPDAELSLSDGTKVLAIQVAAVLEAQAEGALCPEPEDAGAAERWIMAMLGLGLQPEMASDAELQGEQRTCELTAFGRELMITMPMGRSFLIAEAGPAHRAVATAGLILADGEAVSVGGLVGRLRAHAERERRTDGPVAETNRSFAEVVLPDCAVKHVGDDLVFELPSVGVVRLADLGSGAVVGPRVSIFLANGEPAGVADLIGALGDSTIAADTSDADSSHGTEAAIEPGRTEKPAMQWTDSLAPAEPQNAAARSMPLAVSPPCANGVNPEDMAVVVIGGLPWGAALSAGIDNGNGSWTLSPKELSGLCLTPPPGWAQDLTLQVTAVTVKNRVGELATASGTVGVSFEPPLEPRADGSTPLVIDPALARDGASTLSALVVRGVPAGARLSAGTYDPAIEGWVLLPDQLADLAVTLPEGGADCTLTVLGIALEPGGHARSKVLTRVPVSAR